MEAWIRFANQPDTVHCAFIDYRHLPRENVLYYTTFEGNRDTVYNPIDTVSEFYMDHTSFLPFSDQQVFCMQIISGEIPVYAYVYDVVNEGSWEGGFNFSSHLYQTPGTTKNFYTERRAFYYFVFDQDTFQLDRNNYRDLLWPEFRKTFELNQKSIQKAKPWQYLAIIDYYNGNISYITNRKGEREGVFGLEASFSDGFLNSLYYFDFKGEWHALNSKSECLRIESFEARNQTFRLLIDQTLLEQTNELPRHTCLRMEGMITVYYLENLITSRQLRDGAEFTELDVYWMVQLPGEQEINLVTETYLEDTLIPFFKQSKFMTERIDFDAMEPTNYHIGEAIGLFNRWHEKSLNSKN